MIVRTQGGGACAVDPAGHGAGEAEDQARLPHRLPAVRRHGQDTHGRPEAHPPTDRREAQRRSGETHNRLLTAFLIGLMKLFSHRWLAVGRVQIKAFKDTGIDPDRYRVGKERRKMKREIYWKEKTRKVKGKHTTHQDRLPTIGLAAPRSHTGGRRCVPQCCGVARRTTTTPRVCC